MRRLDDLAGRLHPLLREGELVRGMLAPAAIAAEIATEDMIEIGRAHRFDDVLGLDEAERLAALLDIGREPWQSLPLFRAWLHATRDAMLEGAVTHAAIEGFAVRYAERYRETTRAFVGPGAPQLIENPPRRTIAQPSGLGLAPLAQVRLTVASIADTPLAMLFTGIADGPEAAPLIANLTTGAALLWRGRIAPGAQLAIRAVGDRATALLDGADVTDRLVGLTGFTPGEAWSPAQIATPPPALTLRRGSNILWFLPVAQYDVEGLDRYLLALPDLNLAQGRWDDTQFDRALFDLPAAVQFLATWVESAPAAIALDVAGQTVLRPAGAAGSADADREQLVAALDIGIQRLRAAGVRATTRGTAFAEIQPVHDRIAAILPMRIEEGGSSGGERLPDSGGLWSVTSYDNSTFG